MILCVHIGTAFLPPPAWCSPRTSQVASRPEVVLVAEAPPPRLSVEQEARLAAIMQTAGSEGAVGRLEAEITKLKVEAHAQELAERYAKLAQANERMVRDVNTAV